MTKDQQLTINRKDFEDLLKGIMNEKLDEIKALLFRNKNPDIEGHLSVKEATVKYGISRTTIYNWFDAGLPKRKLGHRTLIKVEDIEKFTFQPV
jgi:predicted DNA-binding transcriptional regulator AlpA